MSERLNLRRLDYFVVAAEVGTMSGAAQRLYVSQSAVSLGIAELERQLGVRLMVRSKAKGLALTEAGRELLLRARELLTQAGELEADIRNAGQAIAGRLVVACFTTIGPFLLPQLLAEFQATYPEVTLEFVEGDLNEMQELLLDGRCEVAVMYGFGLRADIECEDLYQVRPYVLLPPDHPLADRDAIWLADLAAHHMCMLDVPPSMQYFSQVLIDAGVTPLIRHRTRSFELTRSLVARGFGYSLLIQHPISDVTYEGRRLILRPLADHVPPLSVVLARHCGARLTPRAAVFAEFCHAAIRQDLVPWSSQPRNGPVLRAGPVKKRAMATGPERRLPHCPATPAYGLGRHRSQSGCRWTR